ncbi:MAG: GNAT family N-acetyltransferase [Candidatus Dormibacteraeota bacterium]|nr:GNAT family N-acetyltransferase [Candidatus Dormibacteraeota bacterium]
MSQPLTEREPLEATLRDGTRVRFRQVRPDDKRWLQQGISEMSPESRYRRFFSPVAELTPEQLRYFTEVDQQDHVAWVATLPEQDHRVIGVARFVRLPGQPDAAEAAVTVVDSFQHRGVGRALLLVITEAAIERGVERFTMFVLAENDNMLRLLHEVGAILDRTSDGVNEFHVALPADVSQIDQGAAPRVLRVAAEGNLRGEVAAGLTRTRFLVGKGW